ncbi:MAG: class I SAM-dependent methyltransferase [Deltaproteobacteria bacterium]|nr:class I SAM-dependent methyltransferase [Deltaproteobacteria bacterium]
MITRTTCRVCEGALETILSLGEHYVSDFIEPGASDGTIAPLELVLCRRCRLLQLKHTVPGDTMYRNYWYRSGTNQTMRTALADIANKAEHLVHLKEGDAVLDIGCNDGTLLASYKTGGTYKIGFDPAENLAEHSRKIAEHLTVGYFGSEPFRDNAELSKHRPKVVTSIAMFYDLEDPNTFVADIKKVMHPDGLWIVQMSYLPLMLKTNELGNICHEHLEYYSLQSFEYLLHRHDLEAVDLEMNDVNGGSIRAYIRNRNANPQSFADETYRELAADRVAAFREEESRLKLDTSAPYVEFATWVDRIRQDVVGFIKEKVGHGKVVYVYGASTKGNTLLQYFGLDSTLIAGAAERNRDKWGRMTVGTHIPIVSEEEARAAKPDYFLVLPWHFLEEFQKREKGYLLGGGRFIVPMPHFTLI